MSGKHRRPEPDPLPDVDLAARLADGPVVPAEVGAVPVRGAGPPPSVPAQSVSTTAAARPGPTVVARQDRAAQRRERRKAERQRLLVVGGGVLGLALVVVGVWLMLRGGGEGAAPQATGPERQQTLLMQVTGADGTAAASTLVGTTAADDSAVAVLVPSRLNVDVAGSGDMPFGETTTLDDPAAPAAALTDLLGVRVEDTWSLTKGGLASLVDAVGGVQVAVDVDVVETAPNGDQAVVVRAGNQLLKGKAAAAYATYLADQEPEQARLARFDDVFGALAAKLPEDATGIGAFLAAAGKGSSSTLDQQALARRLVVLRAAAGNGSLVSDVLPVTEIDTGGTVPSYGLDAGQAAATMRSRFPGALQRDANGEALRVLVENGVGTPGLVEKARTRLVDAGFRFVNGGNASPFNDDPSQVLVPDGTDQSLARGRRVAQTLGLPESSVTPEDRGQTVADVIVILGKDFAP